jgi:multiple sugar transport system substrate-binding protein
MFQKITIAALFTLIVTVHCTKEESALTFAVGGAPNEVQYWEKVVKEFENKTNIKVKIIRQPTDTDQRRQGLVIPLEAKKKNPDVFLMDVVWVHQFAASGWLQSLDKFMHNSELSYGDFFNNIIEQVDTYRGNLVALPVYNDCGLLYYRQDLLQKHNYEVPETWAALVKCAKIIQDQERKTNEHFYGFVWQGAQYEGLVCTFIEFATSFDGGLKNDGQHLTINTVENTKALQFMVDLIHRYEISPPNTYTEMKEEEVRIHFDNGNSLFERNWPYAWSLHNRPGSPVKGKVNVTLLPAASLGNHTAALGGWHVGISKYSDAKESAWALVEYITSYTIQKQLVMDLGWNPGRKDIYDDDEIKKAYPHVTVLKKAFEHSVARPTLPYYTQISEILQRNINAALSRKIKPHDALINADDAIDEMHSLYNE